MHLEDGEDFSRLGRSVTRQLQGCLADDPDTWTGRIRGLESMTESGALRIVVVRDGVPAYTAGEEQPGDSRLAQAADGVGEAEVLVSAGERSIYRTSGEYQGGTWALYLFGTSQSRLDSGLRVALALAAIGVIFVVFLTVLMTNRFLTRFVYRKI